MNSGSGSRWIIVWLFLFVTGGSLQACEHSDSTSVPVQNYRFGVSAMPAGVVLFGPLFQAEVRIGNAFRVVTHYRMPRLSAAYRVFYSPVTTVSGYGLGGGVRFLPGHGKNRFVCGIFGEYSRVHAYTSSAQSYDEREYNYTKHLLTFAFNFGYRFRFDSGIFLQGGFYAYACSQMDGEGLYLPGWEGFAKNYNPIFIVYPDLTVGYRFLKK